MNARENFNIFQKLVLHLRGKYFLSKKWKNNNPLSLLKKFHCLSLLMTIQKIGSYV